MKSKIHEQAIHAEAEAREQQFRTLVNSISQLGWMAEREQQFRTLANSISQLAWMAEASGYIFWYNQRWYDYTGTTLEEMQGWGWQKVHHPDEVGRVVARIKIAFATGEPWEDTFPLRSRSGEYRWFLSRALPIRDAEGRVVRWFGTSTDITEQRQMERELRERREELEERVAERTAELSRANDILKEEIAERKRIEETLLKQTEILESILSNMGDAVIVADKEKHFLVFNPAAKRMFGTGATEITADEWAGQYDLYRADKVTSFPPDELPLSRSIRGEKVDDVEMFIRHAKAPGIWTRISGRPLRDAAGELTGGVIVCRDITEHKKEEILRIGQNRVLEMIARGAPLRDILTSLMLLIESQVEGMRCSLLLLDEDGVHIRHCAAPSLPEPYVDAIDGALIGPQAGSCGTAMYRGEPVMVSDIFSDPLWADYRELAERYGLRACWSTPIMSHDGRVRGSFAMYYGEPRSPNTEEERLTDIATYIAGIAIERKRAEETLQQTQANLERISRITALGELAASIAHEVNQPLAAIIGNADICLSWLSTDSPDLGSIREALSDIFNDGNRASQVIKRIRALIKKGPLQKTRLDINEVVGEVVSLVGSAATRRRVRLRTTLDASLPPVFCDRVQLQQVLLNLLVNGMDAMNGVTEEERELLVETCQDSPGEVRIAVKDSGTGISPEDAGKIFTAFYTTKREGMGMGLSISRSIINEHGGKLWATADGQGGATVQFTLPVSNEVMT